MAYYGIMPHLLTLKLLELEGRCLDIDLMQFPLLLFALIAEIHEGIYVALRFISIETNACIRLPTVGINR
jgi:hypothetical protein